MADGNITIDTILSTDKFDRQISSLEKKMKKEEQKKIKKEVEIEGLEKQITDYEKATQKARQYQKELEKLQSEKVSSGYSNVSQIGETQDKLIEQRNIVETLGKNYDSNKIKLEQIKSEYEDITEQATQYKSQIEAVKLQKQAAEVDKMKQGFNGVSSSLQEAVGRAGRLALSIFGIRSAYMMLRRASSDLASYDEQYATNLEYIRFVLTQAIAPILRWIVEMAMKLLSLINAIVSALFGVNLFSNGSAENFKKMKSGASGVGKAVKEIKKELMGFDEVNILTSQSDTGTSAGAGGVGMPDMDLSKINVDFNISAFIEKIDSLLGKANDLFIRGFTKIGKNIEKVLRDLGFDETFIEMFHIAFKGVIDIGSGFITSIRGLLNIILGFLSGDAETVKKGFKQLLEGVTKILIGSLENIMGIIGMVLVTARNLLTDLWNWLYSTIIQPIGQAIANIVSSIINALGNILSSVINKFTQIKNFVQGVASIIISAFRVVGTRVGEAIAGSFRAVVNGVMRTIERVLNTPIRMINSLADKINTLPGFRLGHLSVFNLPRLKTGGIINMPNKGTYVGGAIGGESGREGVIPLTDQQAMADLGREIGKNVLINLTNITEMNGRVISRQLKQVQATQDFAYNT